MKQALREVREDVCQEMQISEQLASESTKQIIATEIINELCKYGDSRKEKRVDILDKESVKKDIVCSKHIITRVNKQEEKKPFKMQLINISKSGIRISTAKELNRGDILIVDFDNGVSKKGFMLEVVWCKYDGNFVAGLKFIYLTKDMYMFLNDFIKN